MGLVRCPECGRDNVSDTATACPNCGFNIKDYYNSRDLNQDMKENNVEEQSIECDAAQNIEQFSQSGKQKKSKKSVIITAIVLLILFAAGASVGAIYAIKTKNSREQKEVSKYIEQSSKYIEQSNIDSDVSLCSCIKTAMETAATDAAVANEPNYIPPRQGERGSVLTLSYGGTVYNSSFVETLGVNDPSELKDYIKSSLGKKEGDIKYVWVSDSSVVVYIDNTDIDGKTNKPHKLTSKDCQCIYAGPIELYWE